MIGDMREHVAQPRLGIDAVEFGCADKRVHGGGPFPARIGAGEEIIASAYCHAEVF